MPKEFYTERDIEDLFKRGVLSLQVDENVVLTELAYEKAQRLGVQLARGTPVDPPSAPVRPYLSPAGAKPAAPAMPTPSSAPMPAGPDLAARIRTAVEAKLGSTVDPALLEVIIQRVLKSTGAK
jgi:hypothetical protein